MFTSLWRNLLFFTVSLYLTASHLLCTQDSFLERPRLQNFLIANNFLSGISSYRPNTLLMAKILKYQILLKVFKKKSVRHRSLLPENYPMNYLVSSLKDHPKTGIYRNKKTQFSIFRECTSDLPITTDLINQSELVIDH